MLSVAVKLLGLAGVLGFAASAATVDFAKEILPIFQASCYSCHSGTNAQGGLRLDRSGSVVTAAIIPGNSAGSPLMRRVLGQGGAPRMPPAGMAPLNMQQIALIRAWIDQGAVRPDADVDFSADIQPILQASCYPCHSGSRPKGQLRLDAKHAAKRGGISGAIIVPGSSSQSRMVQRVLGMGGEGRMPLNGTPLEANQIAMLRRWIDQGAAWPDSLAGDNARIETHWAYVPPAEVAPPQVRDPHWIRNPIDNFVLASLEQAGRHPSAEAARETLIRRVSLDLTGLPPSVQETEAFLNDQRADAYEKLVERLLASPHYGERWARPWLDLARYADSNGYEKDRRRTIWKYRDWVIDALNRDLPFDQFTIEQIAGDLLPDASESQKIASGFHRNTMFNDENGVDQEEAHFETIVDRVNTTATVWLGSTIGCAQCHNHKFDPFTQKEYYQLFAFFDNSDYRVEGDAANGRARLIEPKLELATPDQEAKRTRIGSEIAAVEQRIRSRRPEIIAAQAEWERRIADTRSLWTPLDPLSFRSTGGSTLNRRADRSIVVSGDNPARDTYLVEARTDGPITGLLLEALPDATLPLGGPGRDAYGNFHLTELTVASPSGNAAIRSAAADDGLVDLAAGRNQGWLVDATREKERQVRRIAFTFDKPLDAGAGVLLQIGLRHSSEISGKALGRFRLSVTRAADPAFGAGVPLRIRSVIDTPPAQRTDEQKDTLASYYQSVTPLLAEERAKVAQLQQALERLDIPSTLVMRDRPAAQRHPTRIRLGGAFQSKGEEVGPGVPAVLHSLPGGRPADRLSLARWLVSSDNPLVGRVTMNRTWEQFFGQGLVETSEDFGIQGERPTHPELLDWLAREFIHRNWSMKAMHRLIVTSAVYRQSSEVDAALLEQDPRNRLLARGPRFRMEAEMIRDVALAASGLLSPKVGGPSVFPPQPAGTWSGDVWKTSEGEDRFRRGLYTFARRTAPYPTFMTLDGTSREFCVVRRARTNTPLQALTTLNDPAFFEAAQALAGRIVSVSGPDARSRATMGFRLTLSRLPAERELEGILDLYRKQLARFDREPESAGKVFPLGTGGKSRPELAAWTMVANVLLNLDEALTKE